MKIEGTGLEGKEVSLVDLDHVMEELGFVRWAWDYKRATFDFKYEDKKSGNTFYLRVPSVVVKGSIEEVGKDNESLIQIHEPYIGKHIYPHGFDYEFDFPATILDHAKKKLEALNNSL
jgi:hypothetical protein